MERAGLWKILLILGILLSLVAFILGWIGFSVADWHEFQRYNNSITEFYGLWAYCQDQTATSYGTVCNRWPSAADQLFGGVRPNFIYTSEGLITTGMILLSLGLAVALLATVLPLLAYLAGILALLAFIFLVIGLPIFGRDSNNLSAMRGDYDYGKRYGFWLMVPTIVLEFLASLLFLGAGFLYHKWGYGNIGTSYDKGIYGGTRKLGPPNVLIPSGAPVPYGLRVAPPSPSLYAPSPYLGSPNRTVPSLLSQYLAQRQPLSSEPLFVPSTIESVFPQPSIVRAIMPQPASNVAPAYLRAGEPVGPRFTPIINLSGETLVGPIIRTL